MWARTLLGGGAGFLLGGGVSEVFMGAMLGSMLGGAGGNALAGAAGAAGAMVARSFGGRLLAVLGGMLRLARGLLVTSLAIYALEQIITSWETFSTRMQQIFSDLRKAAPWWLGGEGDESARSRLEEGAQRWLQRNVAPGMNTLGEWLENPPTREWFRNTPAGRWFVQRGWLPSDQEWARQQMQKQIGLGFWEYHGPLPENQRGPTRFREGAIGKEGTNSTVNFNGGISVTVNVNGSNADPNAIGNAAGNAVRDRLGQLLADPQYAARGALVEPRPFRLLRLDQLAKLGLGALSDLPRVSLELPVLGLAGKNAHRLGTESSPASTRRPEDPGRPERGGEPLTPYPSAPTASGLPGAP